MLIRKSALLASLLASLFGASNADAGCFGKRNCCQATLIVCPPCAPVQSSPMNSYSQYSYISPLPYSTNDGCGSISMYSPTVCCSEPLVGSVQVQRASDTYGSGASDEPNSMTEEMRNLNVAVTGATNALSLAKSEIQDLKTQISVLKRELETVDKKVTVGPGSSPAGVGKAVDDRLPKATN